MSKVHRNWVVFAVAVAMFGVFACNDDDVTTPNVPPEQAVEAGLNAAVQGTVVPLFSFFGAVSSLISPPAPASGPLGYACPDTTGWCTGGSVSCTPTANGLSFDFNACVLATGDLPVTATGNVVALPGSTVYLTLTNVVIDGSPAMSGTGTITPSNCNYLVDIDTSDAQVNGVVIQCDPDPYPTGDSIAISFSGFHVLIVFDGTNPAYATATQNATPVATCTIDMAADPITSDCTAY